MRLRQQEIRNGDGSDCHGLSIRTVLIDNSPLDETTIIGYDEKKWRKKYE